MGLKAISISRRTSGQDFFVGFWTLSRQRKDCQRATRAAGWQLAIPPREQTRPCRPLGFASNTAVPDR